MKNIFYIFLFTLILVNLTFSQQIWINEFSYDCADSSDGSLDGDEFIEIVAPVGTDMSDYALIFFNSPDAGVYSIYAYAELSGTISSTNSNYGYGFYVFTTGLSHRLDKYTPIPNGVQVHPASDNLGTNGIDNGPYAGVILVNKNNSETVHAVLYEFDQYISLPTEISSDPDGIVKIEGPFLLEKNTTVIPFNLADFETSVPMRGLIMIGNGTSGLWTMTLGTGQSINSPGNVNYSQGPLPVELSSFSASLLNGGVRLNWRTETEVNNYGFDVERKSVNGNWDKISFVSGYGNSNSPKEYSYTDNSVREGKYSYRLKQVDNDGSFAYSNILEITFQKVVEYNLAQNYPNPFNPNTNISFILPESGNVKLTIFNLLGQEIKILVNGFKESGLHNISFDAKNLNSGIYLYKLEANNFTQTRKMILVK
jgi:hypothetical protein